MIRVINEKDYSGSQQHAGDGAPGEDARPEAEGGERRCVVVGPSQSGKTALLTALRHPAAGYRHSFGDDITVHVQERDADGHPKATAFDPKMTIQSEVSRFLRDGAIMTATANKAPRAENLEVVVQRQDAESDTGFKRIQISCQVEDWYGGAFDRKAAREAARAEGAQSVIDASVAADIIIFCLPITGVGDLPSLNQTSSYLFELTEMCRQAPTQRQRTMIICLTKYEASLDETINGDLCDVQAHENYMRGLVGGRSIADQVFTLIDSFIAVTGASVWIMPVSSYGFLGNHAYPNIWIDQLEDVSDPDAEMTQILRTSPSVGVKLGLIPEKQAATLAEQLDWAQEWQPYNTVDPFIIAALGERALNEPGAQDRIAQSVIFNYRDLKRPR